MCWCFLNGEPLVTFEALYADIAMPVPICKSLKYMGIIIFIDKLIRFCRVGIASNVGYATKTKKAREKRRS